MMTTDVPLRAAEETTGSSLVAVGVVVPARRVPRWMRDVVCAIAATDGATLLGVIESGMGAPPELSRLSRALFAGYDWFDARVFGRADDPVLQVDVFDELGVRRSDLVPGSLAPDLVIRLDGGTENPTQWPNPRLGTLALVHGVGPRSRSGMSGLPPGGAELVLGETITISRMIAMVDGKPRVCGQVVSHVDRLSVRRGSRAHLRKLPGLVARAVEDVEAARPEESVSTPVTEPPFGPDGREPSLPPLVVARGVASAGLGFFGRLADRVLRPEHWEVAVSQDGSDPRGIGRQPFRALESPTGTYWADPFPVRTSSADIVFVEEFVHAQGRGRLAVVTLDGSARGWSSVTTILDLPTHLSYPFVFRWEEAWYLLPEQAATGGLDLYVAERFPDVWRWHSRILDLPVADATIEQIDDRWWMFAGMAVEAGAPADQLHIFHSPSPLGPWSPHRRNPLVSDVRSARPAGRLQRHDGTWYRVAQDGSESYGYAIQVLRVERLDEDAYRESLADVITPEWEPGLRGTHTINTDRGLTAIDVRRAAWRSMPGR